MSTRSAHARNSANTGRRSRCGRTGARSGSPSSARTENQSQPSFSRGVVIFSGSAPKPCERYSRAAVRSCCAQVVRCRVGHAPSHTPCCGSPVAGSRGSAVAQAGPRIRQFCASSRDGCQGRYSSRVIWCGKAVGSAASRNASTASRSASWWAPCWSKGRGSIVTMVRGVVARTSRTSRSNVSAARGGPSQTRAVSGAERVYQKSGLSR